MKRSNLILIILIGCLFFAPVVIWGFYKMLPADEVYTGFNEDDQIMEINDLTLTAGDVDINTERASGFPRRELAMGGHASYLYYMDSDGNKYLPDLRTAGQMLYVTGANKAPTGKKLTLYIHINGLKKIVLNGDTIWERD